MNFKRTIGIILAAVMSVGIFAGCDLFKGGKGNGPTPAPIVDPNAKFNDGKVTYAKNEEGNYIATPVGDNTLGLEIKDLSNLVGICYTMWFDNIFPGDDPIDESTVLNIEKLKETCYFSKEKGFYDKETGKKRNSTDAFHFWGKPAQGYYRSSDVQAHKHSLELLYNAGVDFLVLDFTFATAGPWAYSKRADSAWMIYIGKPMAALNQAIMEMRAEGKGTPYIVPWVGNETMIPHFEKQFFSKPEYDDCWVYWDGKPLFLFFGAKNSTFIQKNADKYKCFIMNGLSGNTSAGNWSYLEHDNMATVSYDVDGNPLHMTTCVAAQRTYMSIKSAQGREGGTFWNEQWNNVFEVHPKIVTVTWWNEWAAQLKYEGGYYFTDAYSQEYSRDIEPMEGGHGDQYYKWLCEYILYYKNNMKCPDLFTEVKE